MKNRHNLKSKGNSNLIKTGHQPSKIYSDSLTENRDKILFWSLGFYLASQSFTIPILAVSNWSIWPTMSDFSLFLMIVAFLSVFLSQKLFLSPANKQVLKLLIIVLIASFLSYIFYLRNLVYQDIAGVNLGIYQLYRLLQFICVFAITAQIPLTAARLNILKKINNFCLIFVCLSIILTFTGILPLSFMTTHLPQDAATAGPWSSFSSPNYAGRGWGTISYNHAYVAVQVMMLVGLRIHLGLGQQVLFNCFLLFLSTFACFISGSRAGFFSMMFLTCIYLFKKPTYLGSVIIGSIIILNLAMIVSLPILASANIEDTIIARQATLLDAGNTENLSGRYEIWVARLAFLNEQPIRWLLGVGFGAAWDEWDAAENAHMLPLHIILENGIIGLIIFSILFYQILYLLYKYENKEKAIYWLTIALLLGSSTQETFYPVPAFGNFLGFYLCAVAIALRKPVPAIHE